jgi:hypothetical protein
MFKAGNNNNWTTIATQTALYTDSAFYNSTNALYWPTYSSGLMSRSYANFTAYPYDRARNRLPNATVSGNATNLYNDIEQQLLGDCYYLSALAVLGENSKRI